MAEHISLIRRLSVESARPKLPVGLAIGGLAVATVALVDRSLPRLYSRRAETEASVIEHRGDSADRAIYTLPGSRTDGRVIGEMLETSFKDLGDRYYTVYPEKGFSVDSIKHNLLESRQGNIDKPASFYAMSMGGLVLSHLLNDADFRQNFGEIDTVIFDSSPSSVADVRPPTKRALDAAGIFGDSWFVSRATQLRTHQKLRNSKPFVKDVTEDLVHKQRISTAKVSIPTSVAQGMFIGQTNIRDWDFSDVARRKYFISSPHDNVINTEPARKVYDRTYGGVTDIIDTNRPHGSHAEGIVYQRLMADLMAGRYEAASDN